MHGIASDPLQPESLYRWNADKLQQFDRPERTLCASALIAQLGGSIHMAQKGGE